MPRIRTIKPEFFRHHDLYLAEKKSKLPIRVAFSGLWCCADKEGRFKWKPTELKLDVLPYDEIDFNDVLQCLINEGFIIKYLSNKKEYGLIPTFKDHQRITGTESKYDSKLPEYSGNNMESHSVSKESRSVSKEILSEIQDVDNQMAFQNDSKETLRQVGKDIRKGIEGKDKKEIELKKNISNFNQNPISADFNGLPSIKIGAAKELVRIISKIDIHDKDVKDIWEVFKIQNLSGKKYYQDEDAVYSHFINWIKTQNFKEIKKDQPTSVRKENEVDFNKYSKQRKIS